jgi:hypothetical protein
MKVNGTLLVSGDVQLLKFLEPGKQPFRVDRT